MALKLTVRKESEVPRPSAAGRVNEDLEGLKAAMAKLSAGMVLELEPNRGRAVRGTKTLVTRAARELGATWRHWHAGNKVFAQPATRRRRRGGSTAQRA